jgi:PTH1 family peptidyl-tRNA hydrolase
LHDFASSDRDWIDDLLRGIGDGAAELAKGDPGRFMNAIALRVVPPRSAKPKPEKPKTKPEPEHAPENPRSALQKLVDKFR